MHIKGGQMYQGPYGCIFPPRRNTAAIHLSRNERTNAAVLSHRMYRFELTSEVVLKSQNGKNSQIFGTQVQSCLQSSQYLPSVICHCSCTVS